MTIFPVNNMYATATKAWANATISVYPANDNAAQWLRLDDVQFSVGAATGASNAYDTSCYEQFNFLDRARAGRGR